MSTKIIIVRGQVMMQTGYGASQARRTSSNSQDTFKLKKSGSATSKLKTQLAAPMMLDSIKKSRLEHSKSNKKSSSQVSHNNKSVKVLAELQISQNNVDCSRTGLYRKQERDTDKKTGTIPVKNIKEKIIGRSFNESPLVNSVHSSGILIGNLNKGKQPGKQVQEKENIQELRKMKENLKNRDYHYYHNEKKKNVTPRENCDESLLNFSCMLTNAQGLTLDMFEVGRKLGKGRFGDVYMAKDVRTGFMLALKMINKRSLKESQM